MFNYKSLSLIPLLAMFGFTANVQAESIKVAASFPKGSAGEKVAKSLPVTTKITPCEPLKHDAATFTVTYDAKQGEKLLDVYVLFYNPGGENQFYSLSKTNLASGVTVDAYPDVASLTAGADPYVPAGLNFSSGSVTESLFGSFIIVDGLDTGTWQLIGILADPNNAIDFDNPGTWVAWDVQTVMFGMPWKGASFATCV